MADATWLSIEKETGQTSKINNLSVKFSEITGHEDIKESLRQLKSRGRIPHALLFSGMSGIGKHRTARAFAQYIHCQNPVNGDSCGKCRSCLQHQNLNNPDLHFIFPIVKKEREILVSNDQIDAWREMINNHSYMPVQQWNQLLKAGNSQPSIYVNESDDIINRVSISAFQENYKIFIIWLPERLRPEAANKLLKVLEEPFEDTIFILVSNNAGKILPTILSRTQQYNFQPLEREEIESMLRTRGISPEMASEAARIAGGSLEKAEEIACHPDELLEFSDYFKEIMRAAYALKAKKLKTLSEEIAAMGREKILRFLRYSERLIRENFIYNLGIKELSEMTSEEENFSVRFSPFINEGNVEDLQNEISRAYGDIERNANAKLVLFDLCLLLSRLVRKPQTKEFPTQKNSIL